VLRVYLAAISVAAAVAACFSAAPRLEVSFECIVGCLKARYLEISRMHLKVS